MGVTSDLKRYRHVAPLGTGGMSSVELAEDTLLGRRVALKRLHRDDIRAHSRLRREALIGASLTHPNLVSVFDIFSAEDGDDVIVMEYVEGETLAALLRRGRPDLESALRILAGVSAALDAIHAQRIVHRDVKPANVLLGSDGSVKLADLGIAALPDRTRITTDGAVLGTFSYMAPEQLEGEVATPAVDIYALAAVAFEVLSGKRARKEPNPVALAHAISTQPPPDLRSAWPDAPAPAAELLIRAMSRNPSDRPRTASELIGRLRAALQPQKTAPIQPARVAPVPPPRAAPAAAAAPRRPGRPTRPAQGPPPRRPAEARGSRGPAIALAVLLLAALIAVILATSPGGTHPGSRTVASRRPARTHSHHTSPSTSNSAGASSSVGPASTSGSSSPVAPTSGSASSASGPPPSGATAGGAASPTGAVETFYHLAAAHQYAAAWRLADPNFRNQLGGYQSFEAGQAGDRSITFNSASVTNQTPGAATVYARTTSVRDNGTQHCYGPINTVRSSSGWMIDHIDIQCT